MELMEFLYRVMEKLSETGVPIVFKGAMVLNLVIQENNPSKVERLTRDIDGDWIGEGWDRTGRKTGDFSEFCEKMKEIGQAYEKMTGIKNKPDFIDLYTRLSEFLHPFSNLEKNRNAEWTKDGWEGSLLCPDNHNKGRGCG